jgi:hypothetical protein
MPPTTNPSNIETILFCGGGIIQIQLQIVNNNTIADIDSKAMSVLRCGIIAAPHQGQFKLAPTGLSQSVQFRKIIYYYLL